MTATPGPDCSNIWPLVFEYLDASLDATRHDEVASHLEHCLHCQRGADLQRAIRGLLAADAEQDLPPGMEERVLKFLQSE
ncbi:MAG: zf-HC2 domain-containing protein [bacterium]